MVQLYPSDPVDIDLLRRMRDTMVHRGPDDEGIEVVGSIGLGHRRLSIIDLSGGHQPMTNPEETVSITYNGELYNFHELRSALEAKGYAFRTKSDTEVILHAYQAFGEDCVRHLRGMFAFAIADTPRRVLFLARDRLGIKPLYYADTPRGFVFASELKALMRCPWVPWRVSRQGLLAYLLRGYVPDPLTIVEGVAKLPPGHTLTVRDGRAGRPLRYWHPTEFFRRGGAPSGEREAAETLWALLQDAVRSHLVADVPVGAFLSGGIDSSAVVAVMAREAGTRVKTFSIGFREDGYNEAPYARRVAERFGTEHYELMVEPSDLDILDRLLEVFDEPFADASAIPTYLVSRLARQHVKVVLSGDGGDELLAGYDRYLVDYRRRHLGILGNLGLGGPLRLASDALPEGTPGKNYLYNLSLPRMERYLDSISLFPTRTHHDLVDFDVKVGTVAALDGFVDAGEGLDGLSRLQNFDLQTYLPGDILTKVDRMSMATSLESRVPLLDHFLVEFACSLPPRLRFRAGETKYLLKRVLKGRVPNEVLTRPKQGFAVPLEAWFAGKLPHFFDDMLGDMSPLASVGIRPSSVRALLDLYTRKRRQDHCRRLWALVVLDKTLRRLSRAANS